MNKSMNDFEKNMYQEIRMLREKLSILKIENNKLKSQFEWKSAGIPPDVDGLYVVTKRDESPRWDKSYHLVRFKNGEWRVDSFSGGYVYSYFNVPIPKPNVLGYCTTKKVRMNHTKEPWEVIAVDDMYEIHSKTAGHEVVWSIDSVANAQRIALCVNACEGINDAVIEEGIVEEALAAYLGTYDRNATWNGMKVWEDV